MNKSLSVKVSNRYQIAIPSAARKALDIQAGDQLLVDIQDGALVLIPAPADYTAALSGLHKAIWEKVNTDEYLHGEREAWQE